VSLIIGACVVLYVVALLLQPEALTSPRGMLGLLSPGQRALFQLGMTGGDVWRAGWWWTLLTAIFLHGGVLHILFNMMWIRDLMPAATEVYGPARAFVLFMLSGAGGFLVSNIVTGVPTIGASGSIFGLLAALIVYGRRRGGAFLSTQLWQWAIVLFVLGFLLPGVNNWAHGGGFAAGWLGSYALRASDEGRESVGILLLALALIVMTLIGFILSFTKVTAILLAG
jgi:rhomboid protease GluP